MKLKAVIICKFVILGFIFSLITQKAAFAVSLSEITTYGVAIIKKDNVDMWDKKNEAISNAKSKATFRLASKVLKPEALESFRKRIKKEIVPMSNRFLIGSTVQSHGADEEGTFKSYHARVKFKYSLDNFKNLLRSKGFSVSDLQKHKVTAFIEVLDTTDVKSYSWWREPGAKVHPALKPLQQKLAKALKQEGYDFVTARPASGSLGLKEMSQSLGAQYYVSGTLKIEKVGEGYTVKDGMFRFHEALSQRVVSKIDLKKFNQEQTRGLANVGGIKPKKDLLKEAFVDAARKMSDTENLDSLNQGMARIDFYNVNTPVQLRNIKNVIMTNLNNHIASLVERKIENGQVSFVARTSLSPKKLLAIMNTANAGLGAYRGVLREDGKTLSFSNSRN